MPGHEPLVPAHVNVEEVHVEPCLQLDRLGDIAARVHRVAREVPEDGADGALLRTIALAERIDHSGVLVRVAEVDEEGRLVIVVHLCHGAVLRPQIHAAVPVRGVKDPHRPPPDT